MPVGELPRPGDGSLVDEGTLSPRRIGRASLRRQLADQQTNNPGEEALDETARTATVRCTYHPR